MCVCVMGTNETLPSSVTLCVFQKNSIMMAALLNILVYVCVYIYVFIYIHINEYLYINKYICTQIREHLYIYIYT